MSTVQIKLLNNGCYYGDENVKFPVVVDAVQYDDELYNVCGDELIRVGFKPRAFNKGDTYPFQIGTECEVMS